MPGVFDAFEAEEIDAAADAADEERAGNALASYLNTPRDPSRAYWPPTLAIELAMRTYSIRAVCEAHKITEPEWNAIRVNPAFIAEVHGAEEALRKDGAAFKVRAGMQAVELLRRSWEMIHNPATPANVAADLIKFTIGAAGLDEAKKKTTASIYAAAGGASASGFHLQLNLGG